MISNLAAKRLVREYIEGWKQNNVLKIVGSLTKDCTIIESHGPTYHGVDQVRRWVSYWLKEKGLVTKWDVLHVYVFPENNTAFVEWNFSCIVSGKHHALLGASIVQFRNQKISFIHEYRMTKTPYNWTEDRLRSE